VHRKDLRILLHVGAVHGRLDIVLDVTGRSFVGVRDVLYVGVASRTVKVLLI
jgi:hypothetical protein